MLQQPSTNTATSKNCLSTALRHNLSQYCQSRKVRWPIAMLLGTHGDSAQRLMASYGEHTGSQPEARRTDTVGEQAQPQTLLKSAKTNLRKSQVKDVSLGKRLEREFAESRAWSVRFVRSSMAGIFSAFSTTIQRLNFHLYFNHAAKDRRPISAIFYNIEDNGYRPSILSKNRK